MANLQSTNITGKLTITGSFVRGSSDITGWTKLSHCYDPYNRLHVRTPLPADVIENTNSILEIVGYHSYSGERVHDTKILINSYPGIVDGEVDINSNVISDLGYNSNPIVYASTNLYGGKNRVCFSVDKLTCCCIGHLWVRWWNNSSYYADYAWATMGSNDNYTKVF